MSHPDRSLQRSYSHLSSTSGTRFRASFWAQAAGEDAAEELAALLDESAASMHTQKSSKAEKAAWWRTRIALDARLQRLCAGLQTRLGPWL